MTTLSGFQGVFVGEFAAKAAKGYGAKACYWNALEVASRVCGESVKSACEQVDALEGGEYKATFRYAPGDIRTACVRWPKGQRFPECI